ncbi:MAG: DUF2813 domain-containing protein [Chloroflexota bacterium]|nr:MAG: DUF2813 domain-containing protein [Chloroflexota bacterium]
MPKPERLTHLKVAGFRSFRQLDLKLADLTVLVGANGSGKSNLVDFFEMLSFMLSGSLQLYIGRKGGGSSVLHYGPKRSQDLTAELTFEGTTRTSNYAMSLSFAAPDRLIFTREEVAFQRTDDLRPYKDLLGVGQLETDLLQYAREKGDSARHTVSRVFRMRLRDLQVYHFHDTSATAHMRTSQDIDRNAYLMSDGGNIASFLHMLQSVHPIHFERIMSTVRLAVPYLQEFELTPNPLNPGSISLRWRDRNPDYEFGPHQLSDGSLRAIALITALLQPEELLPSLIVIDEPELGLHPNAVGLIGQLIRAVAEKRQVLVATQSPRLLSEFEPGDVVVVERDEDEMGYGGVEPQAAFRRRPGILARRLRYRRAL